MSSRIAARTIVTLVPYFLTINFTPTTFMKIDTKPIAVRNIPNSVGPKLKSANQTNAVILVMQVKMKAPIAAAAAQYNTMEGSFGSPTMGVGALSPLMLLALAICAISLLNIACPWSKISSASGSRGPKIPPPGFDSLILKKATVNATEATTAGEKKAARLEPEIAFTLY